ncbi:hypothetical protein FITA111629_14025 [Filibacter tadaridae]|uniref:PD-(D/E)XK nuclease family transposase n=1 Tax=Filibacter tadaridae TaxID=2483811 RepID=A0A3P5X027_9BACL|nr:hypothetical protein [Filibacter tadaridae]VDC27594.1 hypothetical protein FILTAD_01684 [Filibacter tadaridae]
MNDGTLRTAFQSWEALSGSDEEAFAYDVRLKKVLDEEAAVREAELREQEGRKEGLQKGLKEGRKEEKEITARLLLNEGFDVEKVIRLSRLTRVQVLEIKNELIN